MNPDHKQTKLLIWIALIVIFACTGCGALVPPILVWIIISRGWNKDGRGWQDDLPKR